MKSLIILILAFVPLVTWARIDNLQDLITASGGLLNLLIRFMFALAILTFMWGVGKRIVNMGNEEAVREANNIMVWGITALFIMASIWGIVYFIRIAFDLDYQPDRIETLPDSPDDLDLPPAYDPGYRNS